MGAAQPHRAHHVGEGPRFVALAGTRVDPERQSATVGDKMELGPEASAGTTQRVIRGLVQPPLLPAPAAAFAARTELPSTHQSSQSM